MTRLLTALLFLYTGLINGQNIATRLGYDADARLLIIHADDLGVAHSENAASIEALTNGYVNSGSIMVPCPWFPEIAKYAAKNRLDFGLHLTLTSEWYNYKWGPVTSSDQVSSLINDQGYFYSTVDSVGRFADAGEAETELRNQVLKAQSAGIDITHLDTHMGAVAATPEILSAYIKVGREFRLPVLLTQQISRAGIPLTERDVVLDSLYQATPQYYESGMAAYYTEVIENLQPGLNCLLLHVAWENEEMKAVTIGQIPWGANWRQQDFDFFTSDACKKLLEDNNIKLVTWKEIRDKIVRKD